MICGLIIFAHRKRGLVCRAPVKWHHQIKSQRGYGKSYFYMNVMKKTLGWVLFIYWSPKLEPSSRIRCFLPHVSFAKCINDISIHSAYAMYQMQEMNHWSGNPGGGQKCWSWEFIVEISFCHSNITAWKSSDRWLESVRLQGGGVPYRSGGK